MAASLDDTINDLKAILAYEGDPGDGADKLNEQYEAAVDRIITFKSPDAVAKALMLLDDDFDLQDLMWMLLHRIETFETDLFVQGYLSVIDVFHAKSPEWASRVLSGCLNSKAYVDALLTHSPSASPAARTGLRNQALTLKKADPTQFSTPVDRLLSE